MIGWYSKKSEYRFGYCIYLNSNGEEVKVTEVTDGDISNSKWDDQINKGEVVKYVKVYWKSVFKGVQP